MSYKVFYLRTCVISARLRLGPERFYSAYFWFTKRPIPVKSDTAEVPLAVIPFLWMNRNGDEQSLFCLMDQAGSHIVVIHSSPGRSMCAKVVYTFTIPAIFQ